MFGSNLQRLRVRAGLTQAALAEAIGRETRFVSMLETGSASPGFATMVAIAEVLSVSEAEFFTDVEVVQAVRGRPRKTR